MKQINIRVDDKLAAAIYAKLANQKGTMQSLVQGFFETWLNESENVKENKTTNNDSNLEQTLLNQEIMAKLNQLEKNQDDLIERIANDSNDSKVTTNDSNDSNDSNMIALIAKVESIEIENLQNKTKLENLQLEFLEFKEKTLNKLEKNQTVIELKNNFPSSQSEIGSKGITITELAKLLKRSVWTVKDHKKDIESYTKQLIGQAYKYNVKTKLFYKTNA